MRMHKAISDICKWRPVSMATALLWRLFLLNVSTAMSFPPSTSFRIAYKSTTHYCLSASSDPSSADSFLNPDTVRALDLEPLVERIAAHCGTFRGRQALLGLVITADDNLKQKPSEKAFFRGSKGSNRRKNIMATTLQDLASDGTSYASAINVEYTSVSTLTIPKSQKETLYEQKRVAQAMQCLQMGCIPPLYSADSLGPMDTDHVVTTDDDDWLSFPLVDDGQLDQQDIDEPYWTLEHILQAEQNIHKILRVFEWCCNEQLTYRELTERVMGKVDSVTLEQVWKRIRNVVEVKRIRSLTDPLARMTYQFKIREENYPILVILKNRMFELKQKTQHIPINDRYKLESDLADMQEEIARKENSIRWGLARSIHEVRREIMIGMDAVAQLDVIFAKAAFGISMDGSLPVQGCHSSERIRVSAFIHPLLLSLQSNHRTKASIPVPIDLKMESRRRALIISGPNGGGKTLAMKSFGLVSVMSRLSIPIPCQAPLSVEYFDRVLTVVGDQQNVIEGDSTFTALLNRYAEVLETVLTHPKQSFLVLLDELASGTEERSGSAIGQAILQKLLENESCYVVATTNSQHLKTYSFDNPHIGCAAVLLKADNASDCESDTLYKHPSYRLQYGCIGESYAFGAASRCIPPLPSDVLQRAAALIHMPLGETDAIYGNYIRALSQSLERRIRLVGEDESKAQKQLSDTWMIQRAMISLAEAYADHLSRLEHRVDQCYDKLRTSADTSNSQLRVLGDTLSELRLVQNRITSTKQVLLESGLRHIAFDQVLYEGECVVIVDANSEWNGMTGKVSSIDLVAGETRPMTTNDFVAVELGIWFGDMATDDKHCLVPSSEIQLFSRHQLATWDYANACDEAMGLIPKNIDVGQSVVESKRRLRMLLSTLKAQDNAESTKQKSDPSTKSKTPKSFSSSRERKASKRKDKRQRN